MASEHDTITTEEFNKLSDSQKIHLKPVYCQQHPKFKIEFFCSTCELPVCSKCTIVKHKAPDHNLEEIEDAYTRMSQELKEQINKANKKKDSANRALDIMQHVQEELQEQHIQALTDAENHVDALKAMLDMNMTIMRMEIEQDYQQKAAVLEDWRSKIGAFSKEITEGVYFAENLLKFGNFMTVTTTSKQASVCLKSLMLESVPKQAKFDFKVQFFPNHDVLDEMKEVSIGSVEKQDKLMEKAKYATNPRMKKKPSEDKEVDENLEGGSGEVDEQENVNQGSDDDQQKTKDPVYAKVNKGKRGGKGKGRKKKSPAQSTSELPTAGDEVLSDDSTTSDISFISDNVGQTSYARSFIINANPKKPCVISKEIHLRLLMKDENNHPVRNSARNRTILVEMERPSSCGKRENITVRDRGSDQIHIKFTPSDIGLHKLFVSINGQKIKRYPFTLNVTSGLKSTFGSDSVISVAKSPSSPLRRKHGAPTPLMSLPLLPSLIASDARLREPLDVALLGDGRLVVTNRSSRRIAVLDSKGDFSHNVSVPQSDESPFNPTGITADLSTENAFYVTDAERRKFYHLDADNNVKGNFFSNELQTPMGISMHNNRIYIVDLKAMNVKVFSTLGWLLNVIGRPPHNIFKQPWFVAANSQGQLIVCDSADNNVKIVNERSQVIHVFKVMNKGKPTGFPTGVAVAPNDNIIISSTPKDGPPMILEFSPVGKFIQAINFHGDKLKLPRGMAIGKRGIRTILFVADMHGNCVRQVEL